MNIGAPTEQMVKDLARAEAAQKRLKAAQKNQGTEMTALVRELNQAGISVDNLADDESELKNKIHLTTMEINKQKESLERHQKAQKQYEQMQGRMAKASDLAKKGLMVAGAGAAAMAIPVHLAIDYESAMADVKKVVNFETPQQFKIMGDDIIRLSTELQWLPKILQLLLQLVVNLELQK